MVEATIAELRDALDDRTTSSVDLVAAYLTRIGFYDRHGVRLNAVPVLNPEVFAEAEAADARRAEGRLLGPLDGIPFTVKNSYSVKGLPVAAGSPAFMDLIATEDAFAVERLRTAGAVLVGLTNMPPMADGGMQRGAYGRAESPYNGAYLTAAYGSGSSNGSGTATAASFAAFGLGEETWSSGRAPASNNGLVAYTPSRGLISMRGNWPLFPTMDVVVPHTRTVADMLEVLNALVGEDGNPAGDFWREQPYVELPPVDAVRPDDYRDLAGTASLRGIRLGVPAMFVNGESDLAEPIETRGSIIDLWRAAVRDLEAQGAEIVETAFPAYTNYEQQPHPSMYERELVPLEFKDAEERLLTAYGWDRFLRLNGDPHLSSLSVVDGDKIYPVPPGSIPDPFEDYDIGSYVHLALGGEPSMSAIPAIAPGLRGLEETRRIDFEEWLDANGLDGLVFPANADVAPFDADVNPASYEIAWRNGIAYSNGNAVIRHLGIPTVTVTMGVMADTAMPVGLTFAGRAYEDSKLLGYASAFEASGRRRMAPPRTPVLPTDALDRPNRGAAGSATAIEVELHATKGPVGADGLTEIAVEGLVSGYADGFTVDLSVDGVAVAAEPTDSGFRAVVVIAADRHYRLHSHWRGPYGSLVVVTVRDRSGSVAGRWTVVGGVA
ncbi:amidase [Agromyces sp. Root81]|nr:amidase [Agromyces sp. Root81]